MDTDTRSRIDQNDCSLKELWIQRSFTDFAWLGESIGRNTSLESVHIHGDHELGSASGVFCEGFKRNASLNNLRFKGCQLSEGAGHEILRAFAEKSSNLRQISLLGCNVENGGVPVLTLTLAKSTALRNINVQMSNVNDELLKKLVAAVRWHRQLEVLDFSSNDIGAGGCKSLATVLLQEPYSTICILALDRNRIGNDEAVLLANSLRDNTKLEELHLERNRGISEVGWKAFSRILCNTSSINSTYLSNHTLQRLEEIDSAAIPSEISQLLELNRISSSKEEAAIRKILHSHHHLDMEPLFEWGLKMLPIVVHWLDRARAYTASHGTNIDKNVLSALFQFGRSMPMEFVPSIHRAKIKRMPDNN